MRNIGGFQFKLLRISLWREKSYGDLRSIPVQGCPGFKIRAGETSTIRNCHCELLLLHVVYCFVSNLKWWNVRNDGGCKIQLLPAKRRGLGIWDPLTLLMCKQFRLLRASQWQMKKIHVNLSRCWFPNSLDCFVPRN